MPPGFRDARVVDENREITCDVCVIGSGAAGTTVALRLRDRARSVLLLESGGVRPDPTPSSIYDLETTGLPIGPEARERVLGGTTSVWWGGSAVLAEIDLRDRPWLEVPGWPIERSELMPLYSRACRLFGIPDLPTVTIDHHAKSRGFVLRSEDLDTMTLFWPRRPLRFGELLAPAVRRDPGLEAYLHSHVTEVVPTVGGSSVRHLDVRTVTGRTFRVRPNVVVLACGGIENARILLASGPGSGPGVGNDRDVVGRFYMDHPKGHAGVVRVTPGTRLRPHPGYWDDRPGRFRLGVRISDERQIREELLNGYLRFHPRLRGGDRGANAVRELRRHGGSALRRPEVLRDLVIGLPDLARFARFKLVNRGEVATAEIHNFIEQVPRRENRVTLSERLDPFGKPLPRLEWSIADHERRTMRRLHSLLDDDLRRRGFGHVDSPLLNGEDDPWPISGDASHHMGTTRMGDDPSTSVVDRNCRVHGVSNLYIAGSSVFPTTGSANPTLTIVALALRLADHLAEGG